VSSQYFHATCIQNIEPIDKIMQLH